MFRRITAVLIVLHVFNTLTPTTVNADSFLDELGHALRIELEMFGVVKPKTIADTCTVAVYTSCLTDCLTTRPDCAFGSNDQTIKIYGGLTRGNAEAIAGLRR